MRRHCPFRPSVQPLEDRVVLSFSFSKMLHSVFPFVHDSSNKKPAAHVAHTQTPRQVFHPHARVHARAAHTGTDPQA
jgi:hypothetical protein